MSRELQVFYDWHSRIMFRGHPEICESHDHIKFVGDATMICQNCYAVITNCPDENGYDLEPLSKHLKDYVTPYGKHVRGFTFKAERKARYQEYFATNEWEELKKLIIERDEKCVLCNSDADQVHHRSYKRGGKELLRDLTLLCKTCHEVVSNSDLINPEMS
jgi:hypothetical protein